MHAADKPRVEPRVRAMVPARLRDDLGERDVCLIDISTRGVLATTEFPPKRGEFIELQVGQNRLAGQVKWVAKHRFGMSLRERVSVAAMAEGGKSPVELQRSVGQARARLSLGDALLGNPQMLGRMFDFGVRMVGVIAVGWIAYDMVGAAFTPLEHVMQPR
jgi:PilZ domain